MKYLDGHSWMNEWMNEWMGGWVATSSACGQSWSNFKLQAPVANLDQILYET